MQKVSQVLYPLKFQPIYMPKVWGGRRLEKLNRALPGGPEERIGESWELADMAGTDPSGGGGGEARSRVANGPLAGRSLHELLHEYDQALRGTVPLTATGDFPLLVKFLDAQQSLSVQVHPSPAYAAEHPEAHLKSEAWYVVDADPGAVIYKGVREGVTAEQFEQAIADDRVAELLQQVPARVGDCHYLPSGTVHALGAGVMVAEVQTPSDTTFRVYDWGRTGRKLHVEQAMQSILFEGVNFDRYQPRTHHQGERVTRDTLVHCEHFRICRLTMAAEVDQPVVTNHQPRVWIVLDGEARINCEGLEPVPATPGTTLLLPAEMPSPRLHVDRELTYLEVSFPQAMADVIA